MRRDIVIVGGGPAGIITALTAKSAYPEKSVVVIKSIGKGLIPCAIPYMMHTLKDPSDNIMGNLPLEKAGVEIMVDEVLTLDTNKAEVKLADNGSLGYDRMVLATGSKPLRPPIPGIEKKGVYVIEKSLEAMTTLKEHCQRAKNIVVLGGGFIGAEFADEIAQNSNSDVHVVEMMPKMLYNAFDEDFCDMIEEELKSSGVHLHLNQKVSSINGNDQLDSITLENGEKIPADLVIIGVGGKPNIDLAQNAGLSITDRGSIWVDSYLRTSSENVFAVGDCALKRDFLTRKEVPVWLASTATAEARIAGTNIYGIRVLRQIQGTVAAFSTKIGNTTFASAGLTQRSCKQEGFRVVTGEATAPDHHPGKLPGSTNMKSRLMFAERGGSLLGGQLAGNVSVGELINAITIGIQKNLNVQELDMIQIATHPLLTSAPTVHPLVNAAHQALAKLKAD